MNLNPVASGVLVVWYLSFSLILTGVLIFLTLKLHQLNARLETLSAQLNPVLEKADQALTLANEKLVTVGTTTETILAHGEAIAATVESKTATTSGLIQRTVHAPFIGVNALLAGLAVGAQTFGVLQSRKKRTQKETASNGKQ